MHFIPHPIRTSQRLAFLIKFYYCKCFSFGSWAILARFEHTTKYPSCLWCSVRRVQQHQKQMDWKSFPFNGANSVYNVLKQWNAFTKMLLNFGLIRVSLFSSVSVPSRWMEMVHADVEVEARTLHKPKDIDPHEWSNVFGSNECKTHSILAPTVREIAN